MHWALFPKPSQRKFPALGLVKAIATPPCGPAQAMFQQMALRGLNTFLIFPSWQDLLQTLAFAKPPPRPP